MAIQTFEGQGFTTVAELTADLFTNLRANGLTNVFPAVPQPTDLITTLEFSATRDPLHTPTPPLVSQKYRIRFEVDSVTDTLKVFLGTEIQLPDSGTVSSYEGPVQGTTWYSGLLGKQQTATSGAGLTQHFFSRARFETATEKRAFPISYKLTLGDNGMALALWEAGNDNNIDSMSWFVVQRSVSNTDGLVTGTLGADKKAPVFCVYTIYRPGKVASSTIVLVDVQSKFVVREIDVLRPTESVTASAETDDSLQSIPVHSLVSILENGSYNVNFVGGLNTQRYVYPQDELDLVAYTSADVISTGLLATFTAYGEQTQRSYKALPSTSADNTNVRILMRHA